MGQIAPRNRRRGLLAGAALLALASCSSPAPPAASPSLPPPSPLSMAPPSGSNSATPGAGGLGGAGSIPEACGAVRDTLLSALALPMAAATGNDTADVQQAKEALARMQGRAPAELKEPFETLKSIADDAGQDISKFDTEKFDKAIAPIHAWLEAHC